MEESIMSERFMVDDAGSLIDMEEMKYYDIVEEVCPVLNALHEENEQLKQIPIKLDNRIEKLQEDLQKLSEMDTADLNQQAVEDVATVIGMSLNALMEFRKELKGD
jgi:hypothetical protein